MKLTPQALSTEDINRLWTAFQAHYRATASYLASVVLIRRQRPTASGCRCRRATFWCSRWTSR